ncbi:MULTISPECIES: hypothetical protein [Pseudoxanthomonas]|jgi:hypothetical protein|uniref:hypothetical protein n=1 Tax=Pseudoxanthomonas TaxID=83618 RepID=UPI001E0168DE|nr:hypothetical protein [Pseudoxanthomonas sp.]NCT72408.1 hypothetical protein [Xanthomonadaceae bacterium]
MKHLHKIFLAGHLAIIALFFVAAVALIVLAASELWHGVMIAGSDLGLRSRFDNILESIGMLTIGLVALELAQTVFEEEVQRDVKVSGPTRVRRYLSRFLVVIVIALSIETLVATFELMHEDPRQLPYVIAIGGSAALLLVAWGLFVHLNRSAEELEPEAMQQAKSEDSKVE